jgi:hypothetical protein
MYRLRYPPKTTPLRTLREALEEEIGDCGHDAHLEQLRDRYIALVEILHEKGVITDKDDMYKVLIRHDPA